MGIAERHLTDDETLVHVTRQHWTLLIEEFLGLVVIVAAVGAGVWFLPTEQEWARIAAYALVGVGAILALIVWLIPLLKWRSTLYILTNRRLLKRYGIIAKHGRDLPLTRINDVSFSVPLVGRIMRYGTLHVQSASEQGVMTLKFVPRARWFQSQIYTQVDAGHRGYDYGPPHQPGPPR